MLCKLFFFLTRCFASLDGYLASASFGVLTVWSLGLIQSTVTLYNNECRQVQFAEFSDSQLPTKIHSYQSIGAVQNTLEIVWDWEYCHWSIDLFSLCANQAHRRRKKLAAFVSSVVQSNLTVPPPTVHDSRHAIYSKHARTAPRAAPVCLSSPPAGAPPLRRRVGIGS